MTDSGVVLPWLVIRQDDNGNRYRVGRFATETEAREVADRLHSQGDEQLYVVERTAARTNP
ncbi:SPOR domain-containing protein [Streptomyces sp. B1866]|uniref:SPOR domain-containing protein n=1 Tax=Streptomyces sp. B1866 TaxID=3075431 RepID=UPI00288E1CB4|nr:SPOR domain-containing protein [Streptomyces sp. B1866]MDT3397392.1 SPOR domain-containing protein [Streptomyces sp. B1866]